jgi:hypothetical protein
LYTCTFNILLYKLFTESRIFQRFLLKIQLDFQYSLTLIYTGDGKVGLTEPFVTNGQHGRSSPSCAVDWMTWAFLRLWHGWRGLVDTGTAGVAGTGVAGMDVAGMGVAGVGMINMSVDGVGIVGVGLAEMGVTGGGMVGMGKASVAQLAWE